MDTAARVEASMAQARRARAGGDLDGADDALADAAIHAGSLDVDHPLRSVLAWRRVKAAFDRDDVDAMIERLTTALEVPRPFLHHPTALDAAEPIARRWWDRRGYGHPAITKLWEAWTSAWREGSDPWMAASGEAQLAWEWACAGETEKLSTLIERSCRWTTRDFAGGPSRHPRAPDAGSSVYFAQMDHAQVALRAAAWAGDERLARAASELYADALAEAGVDEADDYWFLECVGRVERAFGWRASVVERWSAARLSHPRAKLHLGLRDGLLAADAPSRRAALLAVLADADEAGPEWGVDLRLLAVAAGADPSLRDAAAEQVERFGLGVFHRSGSLLLAR
jgi:hypothetical protein